MIVFAALLASASIDPSVPPTQQEVDRAQAAMLNRIIQVADVYAKRIGIADTYVNYCFVKMDMATEHKADGSVPYGVNYHNFQTTDELATTLRVRENFERAYMTLCLADAKRTLDAAERR